MATVSKYPEELRARAVREAIETGRPIAQIARRLNIHPETLRVWVRQAQQPAGCTGRRPASGAKDELDRLRRKLAELERAIEILKATKEYFQVETRLSPDEVIALIDNHRGRFGVEAMCRALDIPPSTYYARKAHTPSARQQRDAVLLEHIRRIHRTNPEQGARRIWQRLTDEGVLVARCTVERLMRQNGIKGSLNHRTDGSVHFGFDDHGRVPSPRTGSG